MRIDPIASAVVFSLGLAASGFAQTLEVGTRDAIRLEIDRIDARVEDGIARVEVDETFRNATSTVLEGTYRFKLPADAVVGAFSMWMEGKEKKGRVLEAKEARAVYKEIVRKKRDPGLLEQTGWRDFKVSVFPIPAHDTVRIKLTYAHVMRDDVGLDVLEIPLPQSNGAIGDLRVHVLVTGAQLPAGLDSPSHRKAQLTLGDAGAEASFCSDGLVPDGSFILRVLPRKGGGDFGVTLLADRAADAQSGWFVARVVPRTVDLAPIARDLVFVVDRSGSMQGKKIEQARKALLAGLDSLRPGDRFDVVSFSTDVTALGEGRLLDATPENLERARRAAKEITASGGTNIGEALLTTIRARGPTKESADDSVKSGGGRLFAVVFLTDGDPTVGETDPERILAMWRKEADGARLFAFGVGDDVKDFLLTKLATEGRGEARYVREDENLEVPLAALFDRVKTPLLLDPTVDIEGDGIELLDREPRRLPDLFQGRTLVVAGRFKGSGKAVMHLRGRAGTREVKVDVPVEFPVVTPASPHVDQIWAKTRVERLLDDMRTLGGNVEIRQEILRLGLDHQLVTPYTSFLVVEDGVKLAQAGDGGPPRGPNGPQTGRAQTADEGTAFDRAPDAEGGRGGNTTPPGNPSGPGTQGSGAPTGGVRASAGLTGRRNSGEGFERWEFWWEHNCDAFLASGAKRPGGKELQSAVAPELLDALDSPDADVADSAALALARIVPAADADPKQLDALINALGHPQRTVRQSATLALGVLGRSEAIVPLRELLNDSDAGRKLANASGQVEPLMRAFAAASLGLLHAEPAIDDLVEVVRHASSAETSVQALAVVALGMMRARQDQIALYLLDVAENRNLSELVRAQAPLALARLGRSGGPGSGVAHAHLSSHLVPRFLDDKTDNQVRRSLAIAIGLLATIEDADAIDALMAAVANGKDDQTRHFAIMAVAEIGARDAAPPDHAAAHAKVREFLLRELTAPKRVTHQPFGALALAIYARNPAIAPTTRREAIDRILATFRNTTNPSFQSAMAIALGLLGARDAADELWKRYVESLEPSLKGHIALALGMAGVADHAAELRDHLVKKNLDPKQRLQLARALGMMADADAEPALLDLLEHGATLAECSSAARALAQIGDARSVAPLLAFAKDPTKTPLQRGLAVAALGLLAEKSDQPWNAVFSLDMNYRAKVDALSEILDLF